ncbi:hypothetical protein ACH5RR_020869 [Cinchona calisaya]|uniref:Uncharacterized protein n=1 Tax=Cinchona calisaya TaxID=153742 RepID=A0ABD2ZJ59_9GENT
MDLRSSKELDAGLSVSDRELHNLHSQSCLDNWDEQVPLPDHVTNHLSANDADIVYSCHDIADAEIFFYSKDALSDMNAIFANEIPYRESYKPIEKEDRFLVSEVEPMQEDMASYGEDIAFIWMQIFIRKRESKEWTVHRLFPFAFNVQVQKKEMARISCSFGMEIQLFTESGASHCRPDKNPPAVLPLLGAILIYLVGWLAAGHIMGMMDGVVEVPTTGTASKSTIMPPSIECRLGRCHSSGWEIVTLPNLFHAF